MHRPSVKLCYLVGLLAGLPAPALALPEDRDKPITLEAERAQLDQKTGTSVYEGNVVITQGTMRLLADKATIYTQNGNFQRIVATGNPVTWRYKPAPDKEELQGASQRIEYNALARQITMNTDAHITQGQDEFRGDRVDYDLTTDLVKASAKEGGRIRFTLQPNAVTGNKPGPANKPATGNKPAGAANNKP